MHISFLFKSYRGFFFLNVSRKLSKRGSKIAFYVDVNVFSLSNLAILKAGISKRSSERFRLLAHLSRRLIGELIVYPCSGVRPSVVRRPSVRPSVVHNFKDLLL